MSSVDVIVPCYRYGHFLSQCVHSVLLQEGPQVRVLIIDDESPDSTAAVGMQLARQDCRVTFRRHASNMGHIETYNEGIAWAESRYLQILSADDFLLPGALDRAVQLMEQRPEVGFTFGKATVMHDDPTVAALAALEPVGASHVIDGSSFIETNAFRNIVLTPTAVVRTALQKRAGGYRKELPHSGDLELWLRLASYAPVGVVAAQQAVYRRHSDNMSLAYRHNGRLPDMIQRKAALDAFFRHCVGRIDEPARLRMRLCESLAREAISYAIDAHDAGQLATAGDLQDFARQVWPRITGSPSWLAMKCQRALSRHTWRLVRRSIDGTRKLRRSTTAAAVPDWVRAAT